LSKQKIVVLDLTKRFLEAKGANTTAFENVSLAIDEGEFVCVLGPSGCGKSTFLLCIAGLESPDSGQMLLDGKPIVGPGMQRGIVFQEYALFPWRTVLGNVSYGLEVKGIKKSRRREIAAQYLRLVGLQNFANRYPYQLSGGMRQRVAIARALAVDPEVLLMDEPFGALDALTRSSLQAETVRIWQETRKTIIFVTHNVQEAIALGDRVVLFGVHPGQIKEVFTVAIDRPRVPTSPDFVAMQERIESYVIDRGSQEGQLETP
jgi:NitT/TauT family transport system ATP-binding protein